jgi:hypothetical protein
MSRAPAPKEATKNDTAIDEPHPMLSFLAGYRSVFGFAIHAFQEELPNADFSATVHQCVLVCMNQLKKMQQIFNTNNSHLTTLILLLLASSSSS